MIARISPFADVEADVAQRVDAAEAQRDAADLEQHLVEAPLAPGRPIGCRRGQATAYSAASWTGDASMRRIADRHLGLDHAGATVLEGDHGLDRDRVGPE